MTDEPINHVQSWEARAVQLLLEAQDILSAAKDNEEVGELLVSVDVIRYQMNEFYKQLVTIVTDKMGELPELNIKDEFTIEKKMGSPRKKWDHEGLGKEVAHRIVRMSIDMDTGEMLKNTEDMLMEMLEYAAPSYWRVKNLSDIGIIADEYCEVGEAKPSVIIRRDA